MLQLPNQLLDDAEYLQPVLLQIDGLDLGNVLDDDAEDGLGDYRLEQRAEDVPEIGIGVELGQVQRLGRRVIPLRHDQFDFVPHRRRHVVQRRVADGDADYEEEAVGALYLSVQRVQLFRDLGVVYVKHGRRSRTRPLIPRNWTVR